MSQYVDLSCPCGVLSEDVRVESCSYDILHECPACGKLTAKRIFTLPAIMGKAAYRDGYARPGFAEIKEKLDRQIDSYNLPPEQRGELNAEIKKLDRAVKDATTKRPEERPL
jgi:hypothetical protein